MEEVVKRAKGFVLVCGLAAVLLSACASAPGPDARPSAPEPILRRPDILDHKNYRFGRDVPEWVFLDQIELEQLSEFDGYYVFKFESPRARSLDGAQLWTRNFTAASQIAQIVRNRVQVRFAGAAAGDMDAIETYMEQVVQSFSDVEFSGYVPAADYWVQMRYYRPDGSVEEDAYTYLVLYQIPRTTLDRMIREALESVDRATSEDEQTVRDRVKEAFAAGM
ncbi:MAG: hypothetical protein EA426_05680 [Spirochaetaceae bacterium]|nr:MAG: hypothetical protein EA426_05680 [Spirochaetaceae bacterium]